MKYLIDFAFPFPFLSFSFLYISTPSVPFFFLTRECSFDKGEKNGGRERRPCLNSRAGNLDPRVGEKERGRKKEKKKKKEREEKRGFARCRCWVLRRLLLQSQVTVAAAAAASTKISRPSNSGPSSPRRLIVGAGCLVASLASAAILGAGGVFCLVGLCVLGRASSRRASSTGFIILTVFPREVLSCFWCC